MRFIIEITYSNLKQINFSFKACIFDLQNHIVRMTIEAILMKNASINVFLSLFLYFSIIFLIQIIVNDSPKHEIK